MNAFFWILSSILVKRDEGDKLGWNLEENQDLQVLCQTLSHILTQASSEPFPISMVRNLWMPTKVSFFTLDLHREAFYFLIRLEGEAKVF